jgi:hypothetical protein
MSHPQPNPNAKTATIAIVNPTVSANGDANPHPASCISGASVVLVCAWLMPSF